MMRAVLASTLVTVLALGATSSAAPIDPGTMVTTAQSIPEPAVITLLLVGLLGFAFKRR